MSGLEFSVFDHVEHIPDVPLDRLYSQRLEQIELYDAAGFYGYHLAEHHTPANHAMAPSQNVFLAAASQRTRRLRFIPTVYVLPLYHPIRLIEEICMVDNLSGGRLEAAVGPGGVIEAWFWGQQGDVAANRARYAETLTIVRQGLIDGVVDYQGQFYSFDRVRMHLHPLQKPCPPFWYMRNAETAARQGFNCILEGSLDHVQANVTRFRRLWDERFGPGAPTEQGHQPKVGANFYLVLADTDEEAIALGRQAWDTFRSNLRDPRRIEVERRGLHHLIGGSAFAGDYGPDTAPTAILPMSSMRHHLATDEMAGIEASLSGLSPDERAARERRRLPGNLGAGIIAGPNILAGSPDTMRQFMDEYLTTGANYLICAFQFGSLSHQQALRSIELFSQKVMPHYQRARVPATA